MANIKKKTYDDTFLFNLPGEMAKHHNHITDFIVRSERIENKRADDFRSVIDDIRRYQKSAIIYHVLMRDDVVICMNEVEMPPSFKVFTAKDTKYGKAKKVFIDASGIIEYKNGAYYCKNVQRLITYLFQAITWLLYEYEPESLLNNSNITLSATDCFVKLFDYIVGYFRFYGFKDNRTKIDYLAALYFMVNVLGKDDDPYTEQVAAKLVKMDQSLTKSYSLYYQKEDFTNINTFINLLTETFKLKGLTTESFLSRWISNVGIGTQYGVEYFPAFTNTIIAAYIGANIVKQKGIESQCDTSMIKLSEAILNLGSAQLDKGKLFESFLGIEEEDKTMIERDPSVIHLQEVAKAKQTMPANVKFRKEDCASKKLATARINAMTKYYMLTEQETKLGEKAVSFAEMALKAMSTTKNKEEYGEGVLEAILSPTVKYISGNAKEKILTSLNEGIRIQTDYIEKYRDSDLSLTKVLIKQRSEIMEAKNLFNK